MSGSCEVAGGLAGAMDVSFEMMTSALVLLLLALVVPVLTCAVLLDRNRLAWSPRFRDEGGATTAGAGAFRQSHLHVSRGSLVGGAVPLPVVVAAASAFFVGQTVVPAAPAALSGLVYSLERGPSNGWITALSLSFIPGALSAVYTFRTGMALLRGERARAARRGTRNVLYSFAHNTVLLSVGAFAWWTRAKEPDSFRFVVVYAAAVLLHSLFLAAIFSAYRHRYLADDPSALLSMDVATPSHEPAPSFALHDEGR
jgi:hypothetical protein